MTDVITFEQGKSMIQEIKSEGIHSLTVLFTKKEIDLLTYSHNKNLVYLYSCQSFSPEKNVCYKVKLSGSVLSRCSCNGAVRI